MQGHAWSCPKMVNAGLALPPYLGMVSERASIAESHADPESVSTTNDNR